MPVTEELLPNFLGVSRDDHNVAKREAEHHVPIAEPLVSHDIPVLLVFVVVLMLTLV